MIYNLSIVLVMFFVSYLIGSRLVKLHYFDFLLSRKGRYGGLDGLRGYLALFVFVDHFIITWYWYQGKEWGSPPEAYFDNMGNVGVMIFFMITGFLFTAKIIRDNGNTNWYQLYKSRLFRIYPLYLVSLVVISLIVFYQSGFTLQTEMSELIKQYLKWFLYQGTIINGFEDTRIINAGVDWTLKYEWLFYLSLPLLAWIITKGKWVIILFTISILIVSLMKIQLIYINTSFLIFFVIGAFVAYLNTVIDYVYLQKINSHFVSFIASGLLILAMGYPETYSIIQIIAASLFFMLVVFGNTLFGLFDSKASLLLGEISYSIYLLHAIMLYIVLAMWEIVDVELFSLREYELMMPLFAIVVIVISTVSHILIELPGINYGKKSL